MSATLEIIIAAIIIVGLLIAIFRNGQANPIATGALSRRIDTLEHGFKELKAHADALEKQVANLPTKRDLDNLKSLMESDAKLNKQTHQAVDRLENFFIKRGIEG